MIVLTKNCVVCNNVFVKPKTRATKNWKISKYCSDVCRLSVFKQSKGFWLGKTRDCYWFKGKKQSTEHKDKMVATRRKNGTYRKQTNEERTRLLPFRPRGENHYKWKGGITTENLKIRHSLDAKFWREAVFKRDNFTCQECKIRGGRLNAHHIKPFAFFPELRFAIDNGLTLCWGCHKKTPTFGNKIGNYNCSYHRN